MIVCVSWRVSDRVRYIHSMNCGYGAGHNIAIREAMEVGAIYHVIVNPDIYFGEGVLEQLVAYMNVNKEIGLVMPKILYQMESYNICVNYYLLHLIYY